MVVEGVAVLNRPSITWKDLSRHGDGGPVSQADTWRKSIARRNTKQRPEGGRCWLCQKNPKETMWQVKSESGRIIGGDSREGKGKGSRSGWLCSLHKDVCWLLESTQKLEEVK